MKAYTLTFAMAWTAFTLIYMCCVAVSIGLFSFLIWHIPEGIAYLTILRIAIVAGFVTTLFYMPSKEGKEGLAAMQGVWK